MSGETIHVAGVHSWHGLTLLRDDAEAQGRYYGPIQHWMDASDVAWLVYCLKAMPDDERYFINGKWALIQHLDSLVTAAAHSAVIKPTQGGE